MKKIALLGTAVLLVLHLIGCAALLPAPAAGGEDDTSVEITLSMTSQMLQEKSGDATVYEILWQDIALSEDSAAAYPLLSAYFDERNASVRASALEQEQEFIEIWKETTDDMQLWYLYSARSYTVGRLDSSIVSIISNYEDFWGGAHGYYSSMGINVDPNTGKDVLFSDVVTDRDVFDALLYEHLMKSNPYEIREENRQEFLDTYWERGYNWSIDYEKLTVYFNPDEIASYAAGLITFELYFDEHPGLIAEKYQSSDGTAR